MKGYEKKGTKLKREVKKKKINHKDTKTQS
jgi:hypothetical protein